MRPRQGSGPAPATTGDEPRGIASGTGERHKSLTSLANPTQAFLLIELVLTDDDERGPWPPIGDGNWHVVYRGDSHTLWRRLYLETF